MSQIPEAGAPFNTARRHPCFSAGTLRVFQQISWLEVDIPPSGVRWLLVICGRFVEVI